MSVAIIPARGGSTRIPGKNWNLFHGIPIIMYSIATAMESKLFDRIIVSTDSVEVRAVAKFAGVEVHDRKPEYCEDQVGTQEVAKNVLEECNVHHGRACVIYATAPLLVPSDLHRAHKLLERHDANTVRFVYAVDSKGRDTGDFYFGLVDAFLSEASLEGRGVWTIKMPDSRAIDINTPEDWAQAEAMFRALQLA